MLFIAVAPSKPIPEPPSKPSPKPLPKPPSKAPTAPANKQTIVKKVEKVKEVKEVKEEKTEDIIEEMFEDDWTDFDIKSPMEINKPDLIEEKPTIVKNEESATRAIHNDFELNISSERILKDHVGPTLRSNRSPHIESVFVEDVMHPTLANVIPSNIDIKDENSFDGNDDWQNDNFFEKIEWSIKEEDVKSEKSAPVKSTEKKAVPLEASNIPIVIKPKFSQNRIKMEENLQPIKPKFKQEFKKPVAAPVQSRKVEKPEKFGGKCKQCKHKCHDLHRHMVEYHSEHDRPFECYICHKNFKKFTQVRYHLITICSGEEPNYICQFCGTSFQTSTQLRKHIVNRHQTARPFKCERCPKSFKNRHALNVHNRVHSGVKPYICAVCSETFGKIINCLEL